MKTVIDDINIKKKCQIFTPDEIVDKMLALAKFEDNLYEKRMLENSCGNGQILTKIVCKYIESGRNNLLSDRKIIRALENNITAYDIDKDQIKECKSNLSDIASAYGLRNIEWNIICGDFLKSNSNQKYDYIIGNPPYISYPDLTKSIRKYIKKNYKTCKKGKFDYYYAFIEKSYELLAENGVLIYLIPNNMFKNVFASEVRSLIKNELEIIIDYPNDGVFKDVLVSPAIIKLKKGYNPQKLHYMVFDNGTKKEYRIDKKHLVKEKWAFLPAEITNGKKVGDYFRVSSCIATLLNDAFVLSGCTFDDEYCYFGKTKIERTIIKRAASPKSKKYQKNEYIIFPYYYDTNGIIKPYSEKEMNDKFPLALIYLKNRKKKLEKRNADKNAAWYMYGRSQALQNSNQEMILISSIISDCTKAYLLSADEIPYSGLYIIPTGDVSLKKLLKCLNSQSFKSHIQNVGVCVNGKSRRITPKDIKSFIFETQ